MTSDRKCPACGGEMVSGQFPHGPKIVLPNQPGSPFSVIGHACVRCGHVDLQVQEIERLHAGAPHDHPVQESDF